MVYTRLLCPFLYLFLLISPTALAAHEVHLKNGSVIKTDYVDRDSAQLTYRQFGGDISIPLSEVVKIIYSDKRPKKSTGYSNVVKPGSGIDLKAILESKLLPSGPIENANLAVVSVITSAGSGSGFFINDDGLIVTNRHVIRGSDVNNQKVEQVMAEATKRLAEWQRNLKREKSHIDQYGKNLKQNWTSFKKTTSEQGDRISKDRRLAVENSLKEKSRYLEEWLRDYDGRRNEFLAKKREIDRGKKDFQQKTRELSSQSRFTITLADGEDKSAILYRISDHLDLALLKLNGYQTPYLEAADADSVTLGQQVYAIGSPLQLKNSVTSGVISNFRGQYIQTNSAIYPGNSGGPLVTEDGRVVGVNSMKLITEKFEGIGFAININEVLAEFPDFFTE
jgi:serine protease Do